MWALLGCSRVLGRRARSRLREYSEGTSGILEPKEGQKGTAGAT